MPLGLSVRHGLAVLRSFLGKLPHRLGRRRHFRRRHQLPFLAIDGFEDFATKVHGKEGVAHDFEPEYRRTTGDDAVVPSLTIAGRGQTATEVPAANVTGTLDRKSVV